MTDELDKRIAGLSPEKRAIFEQRLKKIATAEDDSNTIVPLKDRDSAKLSFAQQRLWFLYRMDPDSPFYNMSSAWRLRGLLDIDVLKNALNSVIQRHEALRTTFCMREGEPIQHIAPLLTAPLPVVDLHDLPATQHESEVQRLATEGAQQVFHLEKGPLLNVKLLHFQKQEHVLLLVMHHIVSDGWSMSVFMRELSTLYRALITGQSDPLPALPMQYADFAEWQRDWLQGEVLDKQVHYWKEQLAGAPPVLELFTDRQRPALQSFKGAHATVLLDSTLADAVNTLSRQESCTLFMTLLAALQVLLQRYTHQQDIIVGSPIASRNRQEIETLIGFFVNTLVLRTDLSGAPTFRELLERVRETTLGAFSHQDLPFEKIVEELKPERSLSYSPLFQVVFTLQNASTDTMQLEGIDIERVEIDSGVEKFDLTVFAHETSEGIRFLWSYNTDICNPDTIERMTRHYQVLLEQIVAHPDTSIADYELLSSGERQQQLFDWNNTATDYPRDRCIQQLFEAQAARSPEAVALVHEDRQLSYADLNTRANRLAHYLIEQGVGPDTLVALCLERSFDLVLAVLGILKAGGAYVPLDPGYPQERLAFMLEDTQAPVLITQTSLQGVLPSHKATVLCLDNGDPLAGYAEDNPAIRTESHHLAYINYTSGSTGKPKGVCIPHQAVTRLVFGANYVTLDASKTLLHMAPISFDAATFELWGALLQGGRCVLYPEPVPTPEGLKAVIAEQGVDTLWLTAAFFNVVVDTDAEILGSVKQVLTGGEALSVSHIRKALQQLPATQLINGYGPTESTTFTCCYNIPGTCDASLGSIPIGRPISNTQTYVLDGQLRPVPIGVVGELYIGGDGLARGYLNRPELTAERFIANPLPDTPGDRLYKTGDLVRYLADGNIEFMGRSDDQVKIRGFRIEPGEIEATLSRHPQVQNSLVLVREERAGGKRLVAYVVSEEVDEAFTARLRDYLKETLPEYMVPSAFMVLDAFPLTPNGKVDKKALSAMDLAPSVETGYVAPDTPVEEALAAIWCELLQLDRVGIHDDFFQLGGHSLLAMQVISRMNAALNIEFPLRIFFEFPTIAGQASRIAQEQTENIDEELEDILDELEGMSEEEQAAIVF
ncbi:MAG TPA: amino acid adenylation domain-containing protein, partial [Gammaproteobacteria bacterium]|nr:amino acid adenylation domain-containing protein [Gammaproteobacteria bacterium]